MTIDSDAKLRTRSVAVRNQHELLRGVRIERDWGFRRAALQAGDELVQDRLRPRLAGQLVNDNFEGVSQPIAILVAVDRVGLDIIALGIERDDVPHGREVLRLVRIEFNLHEAGLQAVWRIRPVGGNLTAA